MTQADSLTSPLKQYKFCPKCGGDFDHRGGNHLKCQNCSYNYFVNQAPTAGIIVVNEKNEVLLAKRKFDPKKGTWQSVGGFVGLDESLEQAVAREAKEELGVSIKIKGFLTSFPETYNFGGVDVPFLAIYFLAELDSDKPLQPTDDVEEVRYFSRAQLSELDVTYPELKKFLLAYL